MDHPVHQIGGVIEALCTQTIAEQQAALDDYFTPDAFFVHPLCRVPSFSGTKVLGTEINSLWLLKYIYQWYRVLSPHIDLTIESTVFDQKANLLYLTMRQTFTLWFVPFSLWQAHVKLVTVCTLVNLPVNQDGRMLLNNGQTAPGDQTVATRWFIKGQEDHYQLEEWLKFIAPFGASLVWKFLQLWNTALCWLGVLFLWPVTSIHDYLTREAPRWGKKAVKEQ
ncbi:hypothetical protein BKA67DRAFT_15603 [Truncatella angustata]|uniref:SigF-like NTF2-like domain-containing protein n=1 Tax=Truncatella angustata TaxID=152316 RepID=A0A9P9A2J9_9PEZI|nr:uncharacterized protein BKA67DRAFT_15603 [Truncatella angustata]KAH6659492.1 hypothetical protein BKA67DRAFT_15603 [Truncatella angustata]KAH8196518.1 hypothetical protein TruAng_009314 [Truncatella angustata]